MHPFLPKSDWYPRYWYAPETRTVTASLSPHWGKTNPALASRIGQTIRKWRPDTVVLALLATMALATVLPCRGVGATVMGALGMFGIGALFFLQGARLSRDAIVAGMTNWPLHLAIGAATFVLFPILGSVLTALLQQVLTPALVVGVLFLCALPSTVQSSIALTSMAQGNVAGAICAATLSSLIGLLLTPLLFGVMSHLSGGTIDLSRMWKILSELLGPFVAGHLSRRWIGEWAKRNRSLLSLTDRGSILIVVYTAFSAAVVHGLWHQLPLPTLLALGLVLIVLLAAAVLITHAGARAFGLVHADRVAVVFCGSQKSLVAGIPIASVLFSGPTLGFVVLPIMLYHPMQMVVGAWLARRFAAQAKTAEDVDAALPVVDVALQA